MHKLLLRMDQRERLQFLLLSVYGLPMLCEKLNIEKKKVERYHKEKRKSVENSTSSSINKT